MAKSEKQRKAEAEARFLSDQKEAFVRGEITPDLTRAVTAVLAEKIQALQLESEEASQEGSVSFETLQPSPPVTPPTTQSEAPEATRPAFDSISLPQRQQGAEGAKETISFAATDNSFSTQPQQIDPNDPFEKGTRTAPKEDVDPFEVGTRIDSSVTQDPSDPFEIGTRTAPSAEATRRKEERDERRKQWQERRGAPLIQGDMLDRWRKSIEAGQINDDTRRNFGGALPNFHPGADSWGAQGSQHDLATAADNASMQLVTTMSQIAAILENFANRLRELENTLEEATY